MSQGRHGHAPPPPRRTEHAGGYGANVDLGRIGVWWSGSWRHPADPDRSVAPELESLGYGALWSSGRFDAGLSPHFERLLAATSHLAVASGIVSIWAGAPEDVGPAVAALEVGFPGRFLLGIGTSHGPVVADYTRPYSKMVAYLDALDALTAPVPPARRVLAALGPRMLELAAARAAGAHPYFVPVEHTARARDILGPGPLLAPEVAVVLETDPVRARELARLYAGTYLGLPNYTQNLRTFGFGDDDIGGGGSDRLIDAVIPWGDAETVAAAVRAHQDAGADHVCLQVVSGRQEFPLDGYRELAATLLAG
jgi:probable F420-dependent oxidoreductase